MPTVEDARHWYPTSDSVHGLDHILRVFRLAEKLAQLEHANIEIVRAAALLHDAHGESLVQPNQVEVRASHHLSSAEFARRWLEAEGWENEYISAVEHCIRAHRFRDQREPPRTIEAQVLFDADKLDAIGAIGVARAVAHAAAHGQPIYAEPSKVFLNSGQTEPEEPHSAFHEYMFKLRQIKDRLFTATGRAYADSRHRFMVEYFIRLQSELEGLA